MHTTVFISLIVLVVLVIAFILAGAYLRKVAVTADDFLLAGRGAPFWLMATAFLGGYVGGASVSGYVGYGYQDGISQMWASLFVVTGSVVFILLFARRLNYFGRTTKAVTISDFICARYGEVMRLPVGIVALMRPAILTGMQFLAISTAMTVVFGTSIRFGVLSSSLIILLYLITAGQYSALVTQWFQAILQSIGILLFTLVAIKTIGEPTEVTKAFYTVLPEGFTNFFNLPFSVFSTYLLTLGLFYLADPWMYMWAYVGKTPKVSSNGMLAVLGGSYYNVLPFLGGMAILAGALKGVFSVPEGLAGDSMYTWFTLEFSGTFIGVLVLTGLLMTIISCGSSFAMNGVTIITRDIYNKAINKNATDKQVLRASRISVLIVVGIGIASALWLPILVPLWVLAQAIVLSGLFATSMSAWFWKRSTTAGAMASTVGGAAAAFSWAVYAWISEGSPGALIGGFHAVHVGFITSIPLMIIVSLCTKPDYDRAEITSWKRLGREMYSSTDLPESERNFGKGFYGYLGADTSGWKTFWVCLTIIFGAHYILSFAYANMHVGIAMTWVSIVVGTLMIFMMAVLGGKDIVGLFKTTAKSRKQE